jgi:uncharacterized membrane protein YccC
MVRIQKPGLVVIHPATLRPIDVLVRAAVLSLSSLLSYWLTTHLLTGVLSISGDDDILGGMWSVVSTIFVYRYSQQESVHAALSRLTATSISFMLCLAYLLIFPFNVFPMAAMIGVSAILLPILHRPDDAMTTGITIAVVMVVAALNPHDAWREPVLRLLDTALGVAVGFAAAWLDNVVLQPHMSGPARS